METRTASMDCYVSFDYADNGTEDFKRRVS
jgi:hypothetical protein